MAFGINGYDLPYIRGYDTAKRRYDSIKPIRGNDRNIRPIGDRRKQHQRIEVARSNGNGAAGIACVLYHTQCVTYYEDGTLHLAHGGYISQSTCKFIERIAPITNCRMDKQRNCLVVRIAGGDYKCGSGGLWLRYNETTTGYEPFGCEPFEVTLVNRTAMREVKEQYAAFMQYAIGLGKLTQWEKPELSESQRYYVGRWVSDGGTLETMRGDDLEKWAELYPAFVRAAGVTRNGYDWNQGKWYTTWVCSRAHLTAKLTHMVKQVHPEVLVREALPLGTHKKDPNHKYVQYIWGV